MNDNELLNTAELQPGYGLGGGKYIIEKKIGEGGFGITYRAVQQGLNRAVCIKEYFLAGRCVRDPQARTIHLQGAGADLFEKYRQAFVKEAQTLASLHHPGIVEVIDIFDENNTSYMVMPFIEGRSLQSIVEKQGPLAYPEAVNYMAQVANAVGYIHQRHILHRDIKPDNIMITADNKAVLIDFGSAREFEEDKTQAHTSMLTHGYAPTEQYTRNSRKGAYTDIYALGATLYYVLTGQVPLEAAARITEAMPEPRELNPALPVEANRTIMKAMQLKAQDRHQNIQEFMDDLLGVQASAPAPEPQPEPESKDTAPPPPQEATPPATPTEPPKTKRYRLPIIIGGALLAVLLAWQLPLYLSNPLKKEAKTHAAEYKEAVQQVNNLISEGSIDHPQAWLQAKELLENTVVPMDNQYSTVLPEVYNMGNALLNGTLAPLTGQAAKQWAQRGLVQLKEHRDYEQSLQCYELSLQLREDAEVRAEYEDVKIQQQEENL